MIKHLIHGRAGYLPPGQGATVCSLPSGLCVHTKSKPFYETPHPKSRKMRKLKSPKNKTKTERKKRKPRKIRPNFPVFGCRALRKDSAQMKIDLRKQFGNYAEGRRSSAGRSALNGVQRMKCGHCSFFTSKHSCPHRGMVSSKFLWHCFGLFCSFQKATASPNKD